MRVSLAALMLPLVLTGCTLYNPFARVFEVDTVGVVIERQAGVYLLELSDGSQVNFQPTGPWLTGTAPPPGNLLIAGTRPEPWSYWAKSYPDGCYAILPTEAWLRGDHIHAREYVGKETIYVSLPITPDFEASTLSDGRLQGWGPACLNKDGQVFKWTGS
jgi:hypothetical protein